VPSDPDARRRYIFRVATNLFHDHCRHVRLERGAERAVEASDDGFERRLHLAGDVGQVLAALTARDRALLWLAYVEGFQHREIAEVLGLTALSIRPRLFRARTRMARELRRRGLAATLAEDGTIRRGDP
jgi:RNA polymerase sigma-70 factor (ECF subfamily)